ncbi:hypothetical protein Y032_0104g3617 [Ancylostoma ceylanicum]|nr:hypothetical protein Y032_0104g3617 [Ancylostoma ceylanicum]
MSCLLVLLFVVTQVAGSGTLENFSDCAMALHYIVKICEHHETLRGSDNLVYDCALESKKHACQFQLPDSERLRGGCTQIIEQRWKLNHAFALCRRMQTISSLSKYPLKLKKGKGSTTVQKLDDAFKLLKAKNGKDMRLIKDPEFTRYCCWGDLYRQIYSHLSVLCLYASGLPGSDN